MRLFLQHFNNNKHLEEKVHEMSGEREKEKLTVPNNNNRKEKKIEKRVTTVITKLFLFFSERKIGKAI
jgi:hypothetical protein